MWEVGAVVEYGSPQGNAILLVVEHEELKQDDYQVLGTFERTMVLWGNGEFAQDVGLTFMWDMALDVTRRVT
jgi:hypothetical protein